MAKKIGISAGYLSDIEKGKRNPSYDVYKKLLKEYGEGLKDIFECKIITVVVRSIKGVKNGKNSTL